MLTEEHAGCVSAGVGADDGHHVRDNAAWTVSRHHHQHCKRAEQRDVTRDERGRANHAEFVGVFTEAPHTTAATTSKSVATTNFSAPPT